MSRLDIEQFRFSHDVESCRRKLAHGSRSFFAASKLLPARFADPATALYAFCREVDDAIDERVGQEGLTDAETVRALHERLDAIYARSPGDNATDRAVCVVIHRYGIPRDLFDALIQGMLWDTQDRRYATLGELRDYAARVAGSVGSMMALIMGARCSVSQARACDLGVAMQLTNIARDVGEDAAMGRLYLPFDLMQREGLDPVAWLSQPRHSEALASVVDRLLMHADRYYDRGLSGIRFLPASCRASMTAAGLLYREIGHELRRRDLNSVDQRTVVPSRRKAAVIAQAIWLSAVPGAARADAPLSECRFLVDAAISAPNAESPRPSWWDFPSHVRWLAELHEKIEMRDAAIPEEDSP